MTYVNERSVLAVGILFIFLGVLVVLARFHVRRKKAGLGLDDWLCLPALVRPVVPPLGKSDLVSHRCLSLRNVVL